LLWGICDYRIQVVLRAYGEVVLNIEIFDTFDLVAMGIGLLLLVFAHPVVVAFRSHKDEK